MSNHSRAMCGKGFIIDNIRCINQKRSHILEKVFVPYLSIFVAIIGPLEIQPRRIHTAANHGQQRGHVISSNAAKMTFFQYVKMWDPE